MQALAISTVYSRLRQIFDRIPVTGDRFQRPALQADENRLDLLLPQVRRYGFSAYLSHTKDDRVILSGTKLRKALSDGQPVVDHFGREEVLVRLRAYYASLTTKVEVKMQGAASGAAM